MDNLLNNPVFTALATRDAALGTGTNEVKRFDEAVSPFIGIREGCTDGFAQLHRELPPGRAILHATTGRMATPEGWRLQVEVPGLQFVFRGAAHSDPPGAAPLPLLPEHVPQMMALAALTKPGPFGPRTIEFGHYYGIFDGARLVAMTGQRLHLPGYSEVSAVCTHPDHLGKGYAAALLQQQLRIICAAGETPFLHVRADNARAIALYERLGFAVRGPMNFYFLKRI
ncbi:GNAT family N-acetyltransferase [Flaviaesturariibacter amylovorans]|uniref:GNAT family N-acetyltransferase n=1 Tax=Flaviaesturariibacter amylovorans TaxID=1084520 RepID=UPI0031F0C59D